MRTLIVKTLRINFICNACAASQVFYICSPFVQDYSLIASYLFTRGTYIFALVEGLFSTTLYSIILLLIDTNKGVKLFLSSFNMIVKCILVQWHQTGFFLGSHRLRKDGGRKKVKQENECFDGNIALNLKREKLFKQAKAFFEKCLYY